MQLEVFYTDKQFELIVWVDEEVIFCDKNSGILNYSGLNRPRLLISSTVKFEQ